jgi:stage II sporulation protein AA (anti-sigma F factor antagonist)
VADLAVSASALSSAEGPARLVTLAGEADITARHLHDALAAEVTASPLLLVVDLSKLTFMDSWALQVILKAGQSLRRAGGRLVLAGPSGGVRRILELTGASVLVPVYGSVQDALPSGLAGQQAPGP